MSKIKQLAFLTEKLEKLTGKKVILREDTSIEDFDKVASALQAGRIPSKTKLVNFGGKLTIEVMLGFNYPDELSDKVFDILDELKVPTEVSVSADQAGGEIIKSSRTSGGPKRY